MTPEIARRSSFHTASAVACRRPNAQAADLQVRGCAARTVPPVDGAVPTHCCLSGPVLTLTAIRQCRAAADTGRGYGGSQAVPRGWLEPALGLNPLRPGFDRIFGMTGRQGRCRAMAPRRSLRPATPIIGPNRLPSPATRALSADNIRTDSRSAGPPLSRTSKPRSAQPSAPAIPEIDEDVERRLDAERGGLKAWLYRLRGLLKRPLGLRRRGLNFDVVLVDRRRNPPHHSASVVRICNELHARLAALDGEYVEQTMGPLVRVYEELRRRGWTGIEAMSSSRLERAARQVRLMHDLEASAPLARLADQLRLMQAAAEAREERAHTVRQQDAAASTEVRETDFTEFERQDTVAPDALDSKAPPASATQDTANAPAAAPSIAATPAAQSAETRPAA